jgi:hypothetical protein
MANRKSYTRDGDAEVRPTALGLQERSEEGIASNILADRLGPLHDQSGATQPNDHRD